MKLAGTSDKSPSLSSVGMFIDELHPVFENMEDKYKNCNIDIFLFFVVFQISTKENRT